MQYQEKELFQGYEIRNWNFTPRLYKLFGAAAIFNILTLLIVVQAQVFTTRGCDSPLVGSFCQVLDTIYLGSSLLDANGDFVSKDYQKTELADADITFVDVSSATPPLTYPEGYFALANPESAMLSPVADINGNFTMPLSTDFGGFPGISTNPTMTTGDDFLSKPQVTPTPNKNVIAGDLDDSPFTIEGVANGENPVPAPMTNNRPPVNRRPFGKIKGKNALPKPPLPEKEMTAEKKPDENQPPFKPDTVDGFQPNKKPLEEFRDGVLAKREDKTAQLDLTKAFKVKMVGELDKDGKLDPKKSRYMILKPEEQGDQAMVDLAKAAIQAINDGNLFYYLKLLGVDKVEFTLVQDDKQIYAIINSSQKTEERAKTMSSGMIGLLGLAQTQVKEEDLKTLIKSAKSEQQGKNFVLNFKIEKPVAQEIINRKLQEAEAKKKAEAKQSNSTAEANSANQNIAK